MKKLLTVCGLVWHVIYYVFSLLSLGKYEYIAQEVGRAFAYWIYAMITSLIVIGIYFFDGVFSFIRCSNVFNTIKLCLAVALIPLCVFVGCSAGVMNSIIWNSVFAVAFVMQIVSLFAKNEVGQ